MIKRKNDRNTNKNDPVDYWLSSTDVMTALLLIILLIMMLLMLYIVRIPEEEYTDPYNGDEYEEYDEKEDDEDNGYEQDYEYDGEYDDNYKYKEEVTGGGDGQAEEEGEYEEIPEDIIGDGDGKDKTAVFVMVVDEETGTTIKEKGLTFELYSGQKGLKTLYTYYPVKTGYTKYETTLEGTFYLPEKIPLGNYELHGLNAPKGYDNAENISFTITESLDWSEAYKVTVEMAPSKNSIAIVVKDSSTGDPIPDVSFEVVAAENIITADGTVRYHQGYVIEQLTTDASGYAESSRLYLGKYSLRQSTVPPFYAGMTESVGVEVEQKGSSVSANAETIKLQKTAATIQLVDELYENLTLDSASFQITCANNPAASQTMETDSSGEIYLTELEKNTIYRVKQTSSQKGYGYAKDLSFKVDERGLINGQPYATYSLYNRILRVSIGAQDRFFRNQVSEVNLALFDEKGTLVDSWNSTGVAKTIEGLAPGSYYLLTSGKEESRVDIEIQDQAEIQEFNTFVLTNMDFAVIIAVFLFIVFVFAMIIILIRRNLRARKEMETPEE
ncbi:MAG: hypothetical protein HUJ72_00650 [Blautia sp.]|nr:hypothetical protein [Blautia sp.]